MSKRELHVGVVGLGGRGYSLLRDIMCGREGVHIEAVCDLYMDRAEAGAAAVTEINGNSPKVFTDYKQLREQIARASAKCNALRGEAGAPLSEEYKEARRLYRELVLARDIVDVFMGMDGEKRE